MSEINKSISQYGEEDNEVVDSVHSYFHSKILFLLNNLIRLILFFEDF